MMSSASAVRREHQRAASEFERSCADVSRHLAAIFDPWSPEDFRYLSPFGPRKPAKRAPSKSDDSEAAPRKRKAGGRG